MLAKQKPEKNIKKNNERLKNFAKSKIPLPARNLTTDPANAFKATKVEKCKTGYEQSTDKRCTDMDKKVQDELIEFSSISEEYQIEQNMDTFLESLHEKERVYASSVGRDIQNLTDKEIDKYFGPVRRPINSKRLTKKPKVKNSTYKTQNGKPHLSSTR